MQDLSSFMYLALKIIMAISCNRRKPGVMSLTFLKVPHMSFSYHSRQLLTLALAYSLHLPAVRRPTDMPHCMRISNVRQYESNENLKFG